MRCQRDDLIHLIVEFAGNERGGQKHWWALWSRCRQFSYHEPDEGVDNITEEAATCMVCLASSAVIESL